MTSRLKDRLSSANRVDAKPTVDHAPTWRELSQQKRRGLFGGLSLRGRLLAYFTLLVFASVGGSVWLLTLRNQRAATQSMSEMSNAVATSMAAAATSGMSRDGLNTLAATQVNGEQILAVAFVDAGGNTIASAGESGIDAVSAERQQPKLANDSLTNVNAWLVSTAPIFSMHAGNKPLSPVGRVIVVTSARAVGQNTRAMFELTLLVGSGVSLTAALLGGVLLNRSRRPLKDLVTSVRGVIAGEAESLAEIRDNEQVGELAVAFNEMVVGLRTNRAQLATANADLEASIKGLEQKIADRTAQLESANDRLTGEIAEKEDFLRAVSHDLNAPLRNIGGMVSMLMTKNKDTLPADVVQRLERIRKNVDVEADLINELLELSRIKTRRQSLQLVDTEAVVWELRGMFENDLKTRHIELILESSLPPLYAERPRIRQIFQNLIDNAIKYMGDGPRREIRIGCTVSVTEAAFYVRDTGLGIDPEDIDKVFFVFRRGRGEISAKIPGKGVGLSSVKSIVETYAGQIRVESTLGEGSTFHFTVNGKYVPSVAGQLPAEMGEQQAQPTPTLASSLASTQENRAA